MWIVLAKHWGCYEFDNNCRMDLEWGHPQPTAPLIFAEIREHRLLKIPGFGFELCIEIITPLSVPNMVTCFLNRWSAYSYLHKTV